MPEGLYGLPGVLLPTQGMAQGVYGIGAGRTAPVIASCPSASGSGSAAVTVTGHRSGDLLVASYASIQNTASPTISGGGVDTWTRLNLLNETAGSQVSCALWIGVVGSTPGGTVTMTYLNTGIGGVIVVRGPAIGRAWATVGAQSSAAGNLTTAALQALGVRKGMAFVAAGYRGTINAGEYSESFQALIRRSPLVMGFVPNIGGSGTFSIDSTDRKVLIASVVT